MGALDAIRVSPLLLRRLRHMTREEVSWRARVAARTASGRIASRLRPPGWDRSTIRDVLAPAVIDKVLDEAISSQRWDLMQVQLAHRIRARGSRFTLDPSTAGAIRQHVLAAWPGAAAGATERAGAILGGRYDLLGYRNLTFAAAGEEVDWHLDPVHQRRAPLRFWADVPYLDPANGDHKIIWELNRHQHWMTLGRALWLTGDSRYAGRIVEELRGWLAANPPLTGVNWASMLELGFRSISWTWALHFLLGDQGSLIGDRGSGIRDQELDVRDSPSPADPRSPIPDPRSPIPDPRSPWLVDLLIALDRQLTHIEQNLSIYFSPNTHLTGEALALYVVGVALPELRSSARWTGTGRRILLEEISKQVCSDGGHAERSTHYQRYTLDFYLMALRTARVAGDSDAQRIFADAAVRLAEFTRTIADDTGRLPLIGDDDGGMLWPLTGGECADARDSLAVAATLLDRPDLTRWGPRELPIWIDASSHPRTLAPSHPAPSHPRTLAPSHRSSPSPSRVFAETGYAVLRDGHGGHAVFDVGLHGYMNAGHAHADALSMTLSLGGRPLLVDPGTATYTMDPAMRDRFRASASHNTVTIDGRSQSIPRGPFHWETRADATLHAFRLHPHLDWVEASHDGYAPLTHRRTVVRASDSGWLVVDEVLGQGDHTAAAHWHLDPRWRLDSEAPGRVRATDAAGDAAWILYDGTDISLAHGNRQSGLGWFAPVYGTVVPTWSALVVRREAAPFAMATWIGPAVTPEPPVLERPGGRCGDGQPSVGVRVLSGSRASIVLLRPGQPPEPQSRDGSILDYDTDARVLHVVEDGGWMRRIDVIDVMHLRVRRAGGLAITATDRMPDLHATIRDGVMSLDASQPPARLRMEGAPLRAVATVRVNGREVAPRSGGPEDVVTIGGAEWGGVPGVP